MAILNHEVEAAGSYQPPTTVHFGYEVQAEERLAFYQLGRLLNHAVILGLRLSYLLCSSLPPLRVLKVTGTIDAT